MKHCEHLLLPGSATKQAPSRQSSTKLVDSSKQRARVMICKTNVVVFFLILFMTIISQVAALQSGIHRALTLGGQSLRSSTISSNLVRSLQEKKQQEDESAGVFAPPQRNAENGNKVRDWIVQSIEEQADEAERGIKSLTVSEQAVIGPGHVLIYDTTLRGRFIHSLLYSRQGKLISL